MHLQFLADAGREAEHSALYEVWAVEVPDKLLRVDGLSTSGRKPFFSGGGLVDRALVKVKQPNTLLVDVDLRGRERHVTFDRERREGDPVSGDQNFSGNV